MAGIFTGQRDIASRFVDDELANDMTRSPGRLKPMIGDSVFEKRISTQTPILSKSNKKESSQPGGLFSRIINDKNFDPEVAAFIESAMTKQAQDQRSIGDAFSGISGGKVGRGGIDPNLVASGQVNTGARQLTDSSIRTRDIIKQLLDEQKNRKVK